MSWQSGTSYYNATTHAYYYDGSADVNHAVLVVGWDDDYPAGNFATTPAGNGAFIVKNSWGTGWGEGGYFYVSYYDATFGRDEYAATFEGARPTTDYSAIYQYDPLGDVGSLGAGTTTFWGANKFAAAADSTLGAVGFYALAPSTAYQVWEGASTGSLTKVAEGTLPQMGFHTVTLPAGLPLTSGSAFVVAVKLTTPGYTYPLAIEYPVAGYSSGATAAVGQSYYSSNGASWTDLTSWKANANVCLKAYASGTGPTSTTGYDFAADAGSGWKAAAQTVTITASGGGTGLTIHHSQDGGATWSSSTGASIDVPVTSQGSHRFLYYASDSQATEATHDAGYVNIDSVAPVTTDDHVTASLLAPATITLSPSDATSGMSGGLARTEYKVDGAASYTSGAAVVLGAGTHAVAYRSTDKAGNVETPDRSFTVTVSAPAAPTSAASYAFAATATTGWKKSAQTVTITAAGGSGSGSGRAIRYSADGGLTWTTTANDVVDVVVSTQGQHRFQYYALDSVATETVHDPGYVNIDSRRPVTRAADASVRKGLKVALRFRVGDAAPGCGRAVVRLQIRRLGRIVRTVKVGTRATNVALKYRYTARLARGTYTYRVLATDIAGNRASRIGSARLVVR
jgi:hypothetical protein